ncbi:MAG: hypothetical protein M3N98_16190, partial [Actinomycetota bacterium]|nr:hypothetical protein [Actinomycetota bacterium]
MITTTWAILWIPTAGGAAAGFGPDPDDEHAAVTAVAAATTTNAAVLQRRIHSIAGLTKPSHELARSIAPGAETSPMTRKSWLAAAGAGMAVSLVAACSSSTAPVHPATAGTGAGPGAGIHKIAHVVVIMQENRSFDTYFGTYPGADGIPMANGQPTVCVPDGAGHCVKPFHDGRDVNGGGPHGQTNATADINGGKMDGFVTQAQRGRQGCADPNNPACTNSAVPDVMGWKDAREIPNYWAYAQNYILQDHMFEPNASWSLPQHLFMVSEWSAHCTTPGDASSCANALQSPGTPKSDAEGDPIAAAAKPDYAWTDLTYLMHRDNVGWGYYVVTGTEPDCQNPSAVSCAPVKQNAKTPGIWNPLPYFDTVRQDGQQGNIQSVDNFYAQAKAGTLPAVSWVVPSGPVSEHPPAATSAGQAYVTSLINAVMA